MDACTSISCQEIFIKFKLLIYTDLYGQVKWRCKTIDLYVLKIYLKVYTKFAHNEINT